MAALVAQGLTNREITQRLFISDRTADGHLEHIRDKLSVGTRAQITASVVRQEAVAGEPAPSRAASGAARGWRRLVGRRRWVAAATTIIVVVAGGFVAMTAVGLIARPAGPTINKSPAPRPLPMESKAGTQVTMGSPPRLSCPGQATLQSPLMARFTSQTRATEWCGE